MFKRILVPNGKAEAPALTGFFGYFLFLIGVPCFLFVPPLLIVRVPQYADWSRVADSPILNFGFKAAGQNADIVIFGDSSANHGVDPRRMMQALGTSVLDLPSNLSVLLVTGDLPLRHYLEHDRPPKVIVLYFAAWDLDYQSLDINSNPPYTGLELLLRYGNWNEIRRFAVANPSLAFRFPLMFYRANLNFSGIFHASTLRAEAIQVAETNGHADSIGSVALSSDCRIPEDLIARINFSTARSLASTLASAYTKVLIYVAPVPGCINSNEVIKRLAQEDAGRPPIIMAPSLFVKDQYFTHLFAAGVPESTASLIEAVRPLLRP